MEEGVKQPPSTYSKIKSTFNRILSNEKSQNTNLELTEVSAMSLERATRAREDIFHIAVIGIAVMLLYFYMEIRVLYKELISLVDSANLQVSGMGTAAALRFPIIESCFGFQSKTQFPQAMYISLNMPQYRTLFMGDPIKNTQTMFQTDYQNGSKSAKDLACSTYMGDATLCLPPCTAASATPSAYASSMISTGISGAMAGGEFFPPFGAIIGFVAGAGAGAGLTALGAKGAPPCNPG